MGSKLSRAAYQQLVDEDGTREVCPRCAGHGMEASAPDWACARCRGAGVVPFDGPVGAPDDIDCDGPADAPSWANVVADLLAHPLHVRDPDEMCFTCGIRPLPHTPPFGGQCHPCYFGQPAPVLDVDCNGSRMSDPTRIARFTAALDAAIRRMERSPKRRPPLTIRDLGLAGLGTVVCVGGDRTLVIGDTFARPDNGELAIVTAIDGDTVRGLCLDGREREFQRALAPDAARESGEKETT